VKGLPATSAAPRSRHRCRNTAVARPASNRRSRGKHADRRARKLFALSKPIPPQANANFQQLQADLSDIENKLAASRRFYNTRCRNINGHPAVPRRCSPDLRLPRTHFFDVAPIAAARAGAEREVLNCSRTTKRIARTTIWDPGESDAAYSRVFKPHFAISALGSRVAFASLHCPGHE